MEVRMKKRIFIVATLFLVISLSFSTVFAGGIPGVSGGGQIIEAPDGAKRPEWSVISFGGWAQGTGPYMGEWEVNFHNVNMDSLHKAQFHSTNITQINYYVGDSGTCNTALNLTAYGTLNGEPGYSVVLRFGDFGSPGYADTVRIELYKVGYGKVFDTYGSEFAAESSCVGTARTGLDAGNITITLP
jgi:hypothetical protein